MEDYRRGSKLNPGDCWYQLKSKYMKHWQWLSFPILRGWTFCSRGSSSEERWKDTSRIEVLNVAVRTGLLGPERAPRPRPAHSLAELHARLPPRCACLAASWSRCVWSHGEGFPPSLWGRWGSWGPGCLHVRHLGTGEGLGDSGDNGRGQRGENRWNRWERDRWVTSGAHREKL